MFDRYIDRPILTSSSGKSAVLDAFCFQPEELDDEIVKDSSNSDYLYPKDIKLLSNEEM